MSDIKVGDLVVAVRWSCCGKFYGHFAVVEDGRLGETSLECECGETIAARGDYIRVGMRTGSLCWAPFSWLKRIPPLSELEGEKNKEELTA